MLTIQTQGLTDQQASELKNSLNYMLNAIKNGLFEQARKTKESIRFKIQFDNDSYFEFLKDPNMKQMYLIYSNKDGIVTNTLSLQEALNLNKYTLNIQARLKANNFEPLEAYFTEQSINKFIAIYDEHNKEERHSLHKNYEEFIQESPEEELEL